ncbi:SRPBCC family protein [Nakamurella aerolata]|uniref:SRPBCC family protein n=1 Tax=Nakamurella aerolata TaxID=1656892 RepID=A0A849A829_9ACTN|nr:SRPBCC family protein [Nakamurella aerolata]NNG36709.1 SRPBCC family protein [Nakamurella aerolata]
MGFIAEQLDLPATAARMWQLVRDFQHPERLAPGFVETSSGSDDIRRVRIVGDTQLVERLISCDDRAMRLAYTATSGQSEYHHAAMQILHTGPGSCRLVWTTDVLPGELDGHVRANMRRGLRAIAGTLAAQAP